MSKNDFNFVAKVIIVIFLVVVVGYIFGIGLDTYFDQQDRMLCDSAVVSGNEERLEKCECYYEGQNVRCIYFLRPVVQEK